jgi:hypothetical protein
MGSDVAGISNHVLCELSEETPHAKAVREDDYR